MLDLRRTAAPLRAARMAVLAAALTLSFLLASVSGAHAASGQLAAFSAPGDGSNGTLGLGGPVAVDPSDANAVYVADLDENYAPRLSKYDVAGNRLGTASVPVGNLGGGDGQIIALAVDPNPAHHRVYVLLGATGRPDTVHGGVTASMEILSYSTVPDGSRNLVSAGTLIDFRTAGGYIDSPTAIAVDPTTDKVAIIGTVADGAADPTGVIQYVTAAGALDRTVTGLGAGVDPGSAGTQDDVPAGLAIGPDGAVYVPVTRPATFGPDTAIYRLPKEGGGGPITPVLIATDPAANNPQNKASLQSNQGYGVPISIAPDGSAVWITEGDATPQGLVRGFATDGSGDQLQVYGGGSADTNRCYIPNRIGALGVAAGANGQVVVTSPWYDGSVPTDSTIYVFGPGGTDCPQPQGLFTVDGRGDGSVTVTKGQAVQMDASMSDLRGGSAARVDWDWGNGTTDQLSDAGALKPRHTFTATGTFRVGVKIHIQGGVVTEEVFHTVTVVAPKPTAVFTASTRSPAAGGTVTFDATNSLDPGQSGADAHRLAKYRWDFGDGSAGVETTTPTTAHAFANGGSASLNRTVKLVVVTADDVASDPFSQTVTVGGTPTQTPPATTNTNTTPTTTTPITRTAPPTITFPVPSLAAPSVDARGTLSVTLKCPAGGNPCTGTITLTTNVTKKVRGRKKVTTVRLGTVTFSVEAGKSRAVRLKLSASGRSLLRKSKRLATSAAIKLTVGGQSKTTSRALTLKAPSAKKR